MSTKTKPSPSANLDIALPITAPKLRSLSVAFMAWPGISDVVSKSPGSIELNDVGTAGDCQNIGCSRACDRETAAIYDYPLGWIRGAIARIKANLTITHSCIYPD